MDDEDKDGFNPKREAHPLQTSGCGKTTALKYLVSIPNGKPILFRQAPGYHERVGAGGFNPKREAHPLQTCRTLALMSERRPFQSQTGSPSSSDSSHRVSPAAGGEFQSQTGSPSSSDVARAPQRTWQSRFQSQTGSPSSSDGLIA